MAVTIGTDAAGQLVALANGGKEFVGQVNAAPEGRKRTLGADNVTITNAANNFTGAVSVTSAAVTLIDTDAIALGTVSTSSLTVTAVGNITGDGRRLRCHHARRRRQQRRDQ